MRFVSFLGALLAALSLAVSTAFACAGDCSGDGQVAVNELVTAVSIALATRPLTDCPAADADGNGELTITDLITAVNNALGSCPAATPTRTATRTLTPTRTPTPTNSASPSDTPTSTSTPTETDTPTPSATPTVNQPPVVKGLGVYVTIPGKPIRIPLEVSDPEGESVTVAAQVLPEGATFDAESRVFEWTPRADQTGPFYATFEAADSADPPNLSTGNLAFQVYPPDPCVVTDCNPASGCTLSQRPAGEDCCDANDTPTRLAEAQAECPAGARLFIGRNYAQSSFGRLSNCNKLRLFVEPQFGRSILLNVESRCLKPVDLGLRTVVETAEGVIVDQFSLIPQLSQRADGYGEFHGLLLLVNQDIPGDQLEAHEAIITTTATDSAGIVYTTQQRVVLSFETLEDLFDVDPLR